MDLESIGKELAKGVKTQKDLKEVTGELMKVVLETALNSELEDHLGYQKNQKAKSPRLNCKSFDLIVQVTLSGEVQCPISIRRLSFAALFPSRQ